MPRPSQESPNSDQASKLAPEVPAQEPSEVVPASENSPPNLVPAAVSFDPCRPFSGLPLMTTRTGGRLGNQMSKYATLLAVARDEP